MPPTTTLIEPGDEVPFARPQNEDLELLIKDLRRQIQATKFPGSIIPRTDSAFLAKFIRVKDYSVTKAHAQILKYYTCIHANSSFLKGIKPSQFTNAFHTDVVALAKKKNRPNGVGLIIAKVKLWQPKEVSIRELQMAFIMIAEEYLTQVELQENGISLVADLEGLRFDQLWRVTMKELRRSAQIALSGLPVRVKEVHVLNIPSIFWPIYKVAKYLVKDKILQRVHFHENMEALYDYIDKDKLPQCLGGYLDETEAAEKTVIDRLLKIDAPYEEFWNGKYWNLESES